MTSHDRALLLACLERAKRDRAALLTSKGVRDRVNTIRTCKHPRRQLELLFKLLEEIAEAVENVERIQDLAEQNHRAECIELERRCNEKHPPALPYCQDCGRTYKHCGCR